MPKRSNGFDKSSKRASEAGKKSKRKPLDTKLMEMAEKIKIDLNEKDSDDPKSKKKRKTVSIEEAINMALIMGASGGDLGFIKEYYDRTQGKPKQTTQLTGLDGEPIEHATSVKVIFEE